MKKSSLLGIAVLLFPKCLDGSTPVGGFVKIDFMLSSDRIGKNFILTRDNSTMFSHNAPIPPVTGIWGELVPFTPLNACGPLQKSNYTRMMGTKMQFTTASPYPHVVALVARGNCTFEEKFDHVDDVPNVIGLIMYDLADGESLSNDIEISTFRPTKIPGFLIDHSTGASLLKEVGQMRDNSVKGSTQPAWIKVTLQYQPLSGPLIGVLQLVLLLVMGLLAIAFAVSVYMHYRIYRMQQRLGQDQLGAAREAIQIDEAFLEKLPVAKFHKPALPVASGSNDIENDLIKRETDDFGGVTPQDGERALVEEGEVLHRAPPNETCPICLDEFLEAENLNVLPCGHYYHMSCIHPWLQYRSAECPMCKVDVRDNYIVFPPIDAQTARKTLFLALKRGLGRLCCLQADPSESDSNMSEVRIHTPHGQPDPQHQRDGTMNSVSLGEGQPTSSQ